MTSARPRLKTLLRAALVAALVVGAKPAQARVELDPVCARATLRVAGETGVPHAVLAAISLTETGRHRDGATRSWPWTVNSEGDGFWFTTREEALGFARTELARGTTSFDVGCFQINYRWHGEHFASVEEMFDPLANARYAARFLTQLYAEFGDWSSAAGAYHSRTQVHAQRYRGRFNEFLARLGDGALPTAVASARPAPVQAPRQNTFPLLVASSATRSPGSLVPLGAGAGRLIPTQNSAWALR